jgi:hypothetical protein
MLHAVNREGKPPDEMLDDMVSGMFLIRRLHGNYCSTPLSYSSSDSQI